MKRYEDVTLAGRGVRLETLSEVHREGVRLAADDASLWEVTVVRAYGEYFDAWWEDALQGMDRGNRLAFAVISQTTGKFELFEHGIGGAEAGDRFDVLCEGSMGNSRESGEQAAIDEPCV